MSHDRTPAPSFPPPDLLVSSLHARVLDAVSRALADRVPDAHVREAVSPALDDALRDHADALVDRLLRVERLAAAGQLSTGVAHELRNPLAVIATSVFILRDNVPDTPVTARHLKRITEQLQVANEILEDLLAAVRDRPIEKASVALGAVVREAVARVPRAQTAVHLALDAELPPVEGDARRLAQVVINLVSNAVQALAASPAPAVTVTLSRDGAEAVLTVDDNGPGLAPEVLPRLFDPLFSTRPDGTGLGLALSRRIAEAHGGTLTASNLDAGGARFTLRVPLRSV